MVDFEVGKILNAIEESGEKENTIVVFMGDNGGAILRGKGTLYEFGLNVPMLIRGDRLHDGGVFILRNVDRKIIPWLKRTRRD